MNRAERLAMWTVRALLIIYLYYVFKIIVLKFGTPDLAFLTGQLARNLSQPDRILTRLSVGNFVPFHEITNALQSMSSHSLINLIGNIVIFIPFGLFLGLLDKKRTWLSAAGCSFALSLCLELTQVVLTVGSFDVDDLLLNTAGGTIGFALCRIGLRLSGGRAVRQKGEHAGTGKRKGEQKGGQSGQTGLY